MKRINKVVALFLIALFLHSLVYQDLTKPIDLITNIDLVDDNIVVDNPDNFIDTQTDTGSDLPLKRDTIPGGFLLQGLFTHDSYVSLDQDGEVLELEDYEDMKDLSVLAQENRFQMYDSEASTWPTTNDIYQPLSLADEPFTNSSMFSSTFNYDTLITGKAYFVTHFETSIESMLNVTFRVSLFIYDPLTSNTTEILNYEEVLLTSLKKGNQKVFNAQFNDTYLIPANNRLKLIFEGKVSDIELSGNIDIYSSVRGPQDYQWIINDAEYSHTYDFPKYEYVLGMQIKYRSLKYPDIYVLGVENETYYSDPMNITINVVGGTQSYYRWDSDSFTSFNSTVETSIPLTEDWHYLEIKALDEFNNTRISVYKIGYDPTENFLILNNALNNSVIKESSLLNFSVSGYDSVSYEWDNNGTLFDLLVAPDYNIYAHYAHGWHNLSFYMSNIFANEEKYYQFIVDALPPLIILNNVINDTLQPSNKLIEVIITDDASYIGVEYKWDDNLLLPWSPSIGSIYKTYLPTAPGYHYLTVIVEDEYSHMDTKFFGFNSSEDALLIELRTMSNASWHYGGNVVDVSLSGTNGTLLFKWDNGSFINGTPYVVDDLYLRLNGSYALSTDPTSYHYLTIVVGDIIANLEYTYVFEFRIDQENPVIDSSIDDYYDERFTTSDVLPLIISDNATSFSYLLVLVSIDGYANITLSYEFNLILSSLGDGVHYFRLCVIDIAGNYVTKYIVFYIDTQGPEMDIEIEGLVTLLDGTDVTPYNSLVSISINDEDPIYKTYFSWDGSNFIQFTDTFNLNFPDGPGLLIIYTNDSLGNDNQEIWSLAIDNLAPTVTLDFPFVNSTINAGTDIQFEVQEPNILAVNLLIIYWDLAIDKNVSVNWDEFGNFRMPFLDAYYDSGSIASIIIYAEDIVGNNHTYTFDFIVDKDAPETTIWYFDTEIEDYLPIIDGSVLRGNTTIWFNETSSDLLYFYVSWDNRNYEIIIDPWIIYIPVDDGEHLLDILLLDSTGEGTSPNIFQQLFTIIVDDIYIDYITPTELNNTTLPFIVEYQKTFNFTVDVYDFTESIDVIGLNSSVFENELGLDVSWINDSRTFQFSILATNVTPLDISLSTVVIEFSANGTNKHYIQVNLFVDRKDETTITILDDSILSVTWEEDISVSFTLQDELDSYLEDIIRIEINGTQILDFTNSSNIITFNYSSRYFDSKGYYNLNISVYSTYYRGQVNADVEIVPLELLFKLEVSSLEIIIDNQVVMTATLTYLNGTGLGLVEITFFVYIYYQQEGVSALIEGYDDERPFSITTNSTGHAFYPFLMTEDIDHIRISATFEGNEYTEVKSIEFGDIISAISGGLPPYILYPLIGGSILFAITAIFIGIKLSRSKPFEEFLEEVSEEDITAKLIDINPGVFLIIFDQRKGAVPIVNDHSLDTHYHQRINIGHDNFILRISDQAISSLGFEDVSDRRRIGTIILPNEGMVGFNQGLQIPIPTARGGYENLALIVLINEEYDNAFLSNQIHIYEEIDILEKNLIEKKSLVEIRQSLARIRRKATKIVLADIARFKKDMKE